MKTEKDKMKYFAEELNKMKTPEERKKVGIGNH